MFQPKCQHPLIANQFIRHLNKETALILYCNETLYLDRSNIVFIIRKYNNLTQIGISSYLFVFFTFNIKRKGFQDDEPMCLANITPSQVVNLGQGCQSGNLHKSNKKQYSVIASRTGLHTVDEFGMHCDCFNTYDVMFLDLARLGKKTVPHTLFTVNAQNHFYSRPCTQCSIGLKGGVSYTS